MSARRFWFPTASLIALSLFGLVGSTPRPAVAGVAKFPTYQGAAHHNTKAAEENEPLVFALTAVEGNQFEATVTIPETAEFPVSGKFTNSQGSNQKLTFKGQAEGLGGTIKLQNGTGLVSANGNFVVGSFKITGPGIPELNGGYTFAVHQGFGLNSVLSRRISPLSNITNLQGLYHGAIHSGTSPAFENSEISLTVTSTKPGGAFQAQLGGVTVSGKVSKTGKVTFSGAFKDGGDTLKIKSGKAQLSAEGAFLLGSFTATGTGVLADQSGKYSLETTSLE